MLRNVRLILCISVFNVWLSLNEGLSMDYCLLDISNDTAKTTVLGSVSRRCLTIDNLPGQQTGRVMFQYS